MKRYAITCALSVLTAATIGMYYAKGAELRLPEYQLQTLEGNPAEASMLSVFGSYVGGKGSYPIEVTTSGSKRTESTFWDKSMRSNGPLYDDQTYRDFNALYKDHSGFMRGKQDAYGYYSDQDFLIYGAADYSRPKDPLQDGVIHWSLDVLDLTAGRETRFTDNQPGAADYAYVADVQKTGGEVHVLTSIMRENQNNEVIDKVFDINTGEVIRSVELPLGVPSGNDRELQVRIMAEDQPEAANSRVLLQVREQTKSVTAKGPSVTDKIPVVFSERLLEYNYASGNLKELTLHTGADKDTPTISTQQILEGDIFTTLHISEESVTVDRYDLSASLAHPRVIIKASQLGKGIIRQATTVDGRVYLHLHTGDKLLNNSSMPIVAVADAADGRILYKGTPVIVKANGRPDDQLEEVWLTNIYVKR